MPHMIQQPATKGEFLLRPCDACDSSNPDIPKERRDAAKQRVLNLKTATICNTHRMTLQMPGNMVEILTKPTAA
jgi:hypothetical protein